MSGDNYYQKNLKYLFESGKNESSVYDIDPLILSYIGTDNGDSKGFKDYLHPESFFRAISSISLKSETPGDVMGRIVESPKMSYTPLTRGVVFTDNATANEVYTQVSVNENDDMPIATLTTIIREIRDNGQVPSGTTEDNVHSSYNSFMRDLITTFCKSMYKNAIDILGNTIDPNTSTNPKYPLVLNNALILFARETSNQRKELAFLSVDTTTQNVCRDILIAANQIPTNILNDFNNSTNNFVGPFYYQLRTEIIKQISLPSSVLLQRIENTDESLLLYLNKVVSDLYIKTCFPLIHYNFLDSMVEKYGKIGDFVNVRLALLAKVLFTHSFINYILNLLPVPTLVSGGSGLSVPEINELSSIIKSKLAYIEQYLTLLNNIDVTSTPGKNAMQNIITSLHTLSNKVVTQSKDINVLQKDIEHSQLSLRNLITNVNNAKEIYYKTVVSFRVQMFFIISIFIACTLLLVLKPNYVFYLVGFLILLIVVIKIVAAIKYFIYKN